MNLQCEPSAVCDKRQRRRAPRRMAQLRSRYFSRAAESATKYGVRFDDLIEHLWRARTSVGYITLDSIVYVDELVHAIACTAGHAAAWRDLVDVYERWLLRKYRRHLDHAEAIVAIRALFADLRPRREGERVRMARVRTFGDYIGMIPLQNWLIATLDRRMTSVTPKLAVAGGHPSPTRHLPLARSTAEFKLVGSPAALPIHL